MRLTEIPGIPWRERASLRVDWFDGWSRELDEAVRLLPQTATSPHELLALLMRTPAPTPKRTGLVSERGRPVAVLGLRRWRRFWEPVWWRGPVNERYAMAAREEALIPSLAATRANIWFVRRVAPDPGSVRIAAPFPVFKVDLRGDYERYWKESSHWKRIRQARNRTEGFTFEVDPPGAAAWTIHSWAAKWNTHETERDVLVADDFYASRGLVHTAILRDGTANAAGCTFLVQGDEIMPQISFASEEYRWHGVGTRLYDDLIAWAAESGHAAVDFGVSYEADTYKRWWGPRADTAWMCNVSPAHVHAARTLARSGKVALASIRRLATGSAA